ncbi:MAG: hypothetical protein HUJ31_04100 [Pseudomonadales bacterium]|nr:hypothetical protein [Pseudomonadales bacterium]
MNYYHLFVMTMVALSMGLSGCTSIRTLEGEKLQKIKLGEQVTIYEKDGRVTKLTVSKVTPDEIKGQLYPGGGMVTVAIDDIEDVQVERTDYVKSAAAGVGAAVGLAAAAIIGFIMLLGAAAA